MEHPPPLLEQATVGHLVGQGMLEGVDTLGEEVRLIEELGGLEVREATVQRLLGQFGNSLQQRQGHLRTDDRCCLQELFLFRRQPVYACCEHGLHRSWHLNAWECLGQTIRSPFSDQHLRFHQGAHALLQEEGIALRACDQKLGERCQARVVPEQALEQFVSASRRQRVEPELRVVGLAAPAMLVLGAIVDQQEDPSGRQALDQAVQQRLRLGIDPVQVLED